MISYKALIVFTVIFDTTCCFKYSKERKECMVVLEKVGFRPQFPFYNINFLLQFESETEYIKHMVRMIEIDRHAEKTLPARSVGLTSISSEDNKIDTSKDNNQNLPEHFSYLIEFYSEISGGNNSFLEKLIPTPQEHCTSLINQKNELELSEEKKILESLRKLASGKSQEDENKIVKDRDSDDDKSIEIDGKNADNENPDEVKTDSDEEERIFDEKTKKLIKECTDSILSYRFENAGVVYTYDEKNRYRNYLTSFELVVSFIYLADPNLVYSTMSEYVEDYFFFHGRLTKAESSKQLREYRIREMCNNYFSKKNKEKIEASKHREKLLIEKEKEDMEKKKKEMEKIKNK